MATILYTLFIWPIRVIVESFFMLFHAFFSTGTAIVLLSIIVNIILLPVYFSVDRWQQEDKDLRQRMKKKIADIKAVFKGEERRFILNTYYRQMGYSPLNSLKASVGVLLQVPFFLAAYQFLSTSTSLSGQSFLFLKDLSKPDSLLHLFGYTIHIMPILMTVINLLSAFIYSKESERKDRIQLFFMATLFFVILYQSPSGLVLYWTMNNIFSVCKNLSGHCIKKVETPDGFFYKAKIFLKHLWVSISFKWKKFNLSLNHEALNHEERSLYFHSCFVLFILLGFLVPSQVIASSPAEFSESLSIFFRIILQNISFCLLIPSFVWIVAGKRFHKILAVTFVIVAYLSIISYFFFSNLNINITRDFIIDNPHKLKNAYPIYINLATIIIVSLVTIIIILKRSNWIIISLRGIIASIIILSITSSYLIKEESYLDSNNKFPIYTDNEQSQIFKFSKSNKNTFILFLDRAVGVAFYHVLELFPEIFKELDGFVWYPNTLSFSACTIIGVPALFGGYDYTPWKINARLDTPFITKINESLTMLPTLYGKSGWRVAITDPTLANLQWIPDTSIYDDIKNVTARNIKGYFSKRFLNEKGDTTENEVESFDFDILFRYGLFRCALPFMRYLIYYNGRWWKERGSGDFKRFISFFPNLYYLSDFCGIDEGPESFYIFMNETTHVNGSFFTKDLIPSTKQIQYTPEELKRFGSSEQAGYVYLFSACMQAIVKWIRQLKEWQVYDNTKIIIASDHGKLFQNDLFETPGMEDYNPLLLVKERQARFPLKTSNTFMTQADIPSLVVSDLGEGLVKNPFTGNPISSEAKYREQLRVYDVPWDQKKHGPIGFTILSSRKVLHPDIYKASAWGEIEK